MNILFEVEQGRGWFQYDESAQKYLQKGPQDDGNTLELKSNDASVTIDLVEMSHTSSSAKKSARIRCVKSDGADSFSWSVKEGKKEIFLPASIVELLEDAHSKKKAKFVRQGVTYDLKNMARKQKGCDDGELKRVACSGKAYDAKHKPVAGLQPAGGAAAADGGTTPATGAAADKKDAPAAKKDAPAAKKGSKRKSAADAGNGAAAGAAADDSAGDAAPQMKSVILKSRAPVDSECPVANNHHVFCEGDDVWDCMLNQTNIGNNNNKYYLIQVLKHDSSDEYKVWMRWGRVGFKGQNSLSNANLQYAKSIFEKKFRDKTGNAWDNRDEFEKCAGKYDLLKMDYAEDEPDAKKLRTEATEQNKKREVDPCKLEKKVQNLIELICNVKAMEEAVMEMQYDAKKAPLGKLTEDQIKAGYEALKLIDQLISAKKTGKDLVEACSAFYTRIPHCFGMRTPTLISTTEQVKLKIDLLEALGDIQLALKLIGDERESGDTSVHPADSQYRALDVNIGHIQPNHKTYKTLEKYLQTTHGQTHSGYKLKLLDVFSIEKPSEAGRFVDHGNRMLLWHGSRLTNWAGIFGAGLKIAPPEAPSTGYMFGKGVYFADMASKSANYCCASRSKAEGILLLCEVALGKPNELLNSNYNASKLPKGKHCTKGIGQVAPLPDNYVTLDDGVVVPMGPAKDIKDKDNTCLMYNEYIVYDVAQIRMRYALRVQFGFH